RDQTGARLVERHARGRTEEALDRGRGVERDIERGVAAAPVGADGDEIAGVVEAREPGAHAPSGLEVLGIDDAVHDTAERARDVDRRVAPESRDTTVEHEMAVEQTADGIR